MTMTMATPTQGARTRAHFRGRAPRNPLPILALAMVGAGATWVNALWTSGGALRVGIAGTGLLALSLLSFWLLVRERRRGEAAADGWRQSEERLQALAENCTAAVYVKDVEGHYQLANRRFKRLYRVPDTELVGKTDAEVFSDEVAAALRAKDRQVLAIDAPVHGEVSIAEDDGVHTYLSIGFPLYDAQGRVIAVGGIATDVTPQRRLEEQLRESEAHLRQILDLVPEMVFAKDREGRFVLANRAVAEAYGTTVEALLGRNQRDLHEPAEEVHQMLVDDLEVIESGQRKLTAEEVFTDCRGQRRVLQTTRLPFTLPGSDQRAVLGVAVDISEHKRIESTCCRRTAR